MKKVILFNMVTLDGFFEGPNHAIDWHRVDDEFNDFAIAQLNTIDVLLFGRVTYELMANYWPSTGAVEDDPVIAKKMNSMPKIVFSTTLEKADWNNTRLVKVNAVNEVQNLKQQPGKDLLLMGSATLAATLIRSGLLDEYRLIINPVILGSGTPLFKDMEKPLNLKLLKTKTFQNGNVLLYYLPVTG